MKPPRPLQLCGTGNLNMVEWIRRCLQMLLRKVQIDRRVREIRMTEQHLNRANVRARFEQMSSIAVSESVRSDVFLDARSSGRFLHRFPNHFGSDGPASHSECPGTDRSSVSSSASIREA